LFKNPQVPNYIGLVGLTTTVLANFLRNGTGCQTNTVPTQMPNYYITHWALRAFMSLPQHRKATSGIESTCWPIIVYSVVTNEHSSKNDSHMDWAKAGSNTLDEYMARKTSTLAVHGI
jgi:hypothetical protein